MVTTLALAARGVDRVVSVTPNLGSLRGASRALAHIAVTGHASDLASDHHVVGALDAVDQRRNQRVVDLLLVTESLTLIARNISVPLALISFQAMNTGGLFGHADDLRALAAVPGKHPRPTALMAAKHDDLFFAAGIGQHRNFLGAARPSASKRWHRRRPGNMFGPSPSVWASPNSKMR
jgi:hypothetical protein